MPYINPDEIDHAWDLGLNEFGNMGHIVPSHKPILDMVSVMLQVTSSSEYMVMLLSSLQKMLLFQTLPS